MSVRRACIAATAAISALACHAPAGSARLEGRWTGIRAEGVNPDALAAATAFATTTQLEFRRTDITITTAKETQIGRYQLLREEPNTVVIATDLDGPAHPQTFVFAADETMRWLLPEGKAIVFAKE
jgi:hypothetical protein